LILVQVKPILDGAFPSKKVEGFCFIDKGVVHGLDKPAFPRAFAQAKQQRPARVQSEATVAHERFDRGQDFGSNPILNRSGFVLRQVTPA
jgi:hypothetical protein